MAHGTQAPVSPLVLAVARAVRSAVENMSRAVRFALANEEATLVPCACAADFGDERCACAVAFPLPDRWSRAA